LLDFLGMTKVFTVVYGWNGTNYWS